MGKYFLTKRNYFLFNWAFLLRNCQILSGFQSSFSSKSSRIRNDFSRIPILLTVPDPNGSGSGSTTVNIIVHVFFGWTLGSDPAWILSDPEYNSPGFMYLQLTERVQGPLGDEGGPGPWVGLNKAWKQGCGSVSNKVLTTPASLGSGSASEAQNPLFCTEKLFEIFFMFLQCFALERKNLANKDNFWRNIRGSLLIIEVQFNTWKQIRIKQLKMHYWKWYTEATDPSTAPSSEKELLLTESARKLE
jgi:hypothetical protein